MTDAQPASSELIPGVPTTLGGREYIVPPLNIRDLKRAFRLIPVMQTSGEESIDAVCELIHLALRRNYPELTRDELEDQLTGASLQQVMAAVLEASDIRLPPPAVAAAEGAAAA